MELVGHFKCEKNQNLYKLFKSLRVPFLARLFAIWGKPSVAILKFDDIWSITVKSAFSSREKSFKLGKEFNEFFPGTFIKSVATMENGKLVARSTINNKLRTVTTYEFEPHLMIMTIRDERTGVEAKRTFKKLPTKL